MSRALTARRVARHGVPKGAMTTSPYQSHNGAPVWVSIVAARECGCHVEFTTDTGKFMLVDATHPVFVVRS